MWIKVTDYISNVDNNNKKVLVNINNVDCIFPARSIGYDGKTAIGFCGNKRENCIVVNESLKEIEAMISGEMNDGYSEPKWISCDERLPKESCEAFCTCSSDGSGKRWTQNLYFDAEDHKNWCYFDGELYPFKVHAWLPKSLFVPYNG